MNQGNLKAMVFEFKQKVYLRTLIANNFNVSKACRILDSARGDLYNHLPAGSNLELLAKVLLNIDIKEVEHE